MPPTDDTPAIPNKPKPKKHPRGGFIGPLFSWELFRLARRGQDARGRFILAFLLFLVLTGFSLNWFNKTSPADLFFGDSQVLSIAETSAFAHVRSPSSASSSASLSTLSGWPARAAVCASRRIAYCGDVLLNAARSFAAMSSAESIAPIGSADCSAIIARANKRSSSWPGRVASASASDVFFCWRLVPTAAKRE